MLKGNTQSVTIKCSQLFSWGITNPNISFLREEKLSLIIIIGVLFVSYIVLFFFGEFGLNPATNVYLYQSIPGIILLCIRFLLFLYFLWCLQKTIREDSDSGKKVFYYSFGGGYAIWFLSLPLVVFISFGFSAWYRQKVVDTLMLLITAFGFTMIGFLLWPSRASKYFAISGPDVFKGNVVHFRFI